MRAAEASPRPGFLADAMVADLARWLRILGEDCLWAPPSWSDDDVLRVAAEDHRILVTRDDLLVVRARNGGLQGVRVPEGPAQEVLPVVFAQAGLVPDERRLASRCSVCNGRLLRVDAREAHRRAVEAGKKPPLDEVSRRHETFWSCTVCAQPFWRGTHWTEIERVRRQVLDALAGS